MRFLLMPRFWCCCVCLFLCSVQAQPAAADSGPLSVEAMWQLQRVGDPDLSPDGKLVVVPVTRYDVDKNKGFSDLWLIPTAAGPARQLTSDDAQDNEPRFSPDGKWIAFVSKRGEDKDNQLYVIAIDGGEARRVTRIPTGVSAPKWFPDSKRIAFITSVWPDLKTWSEMEQRIKERADSKMTAKVWDKAPFSYWDHFIEDREPHVYAVAVDGGDPQAHHARHRLSPLDHRNRAPAVTTSRPTAPRLRSRPIPIAAASTRTSMCSSCPSSGGEARNLTTDNAADDGEPKYSRDGRYLAFVRQKIKTFYADKQRLMLFDRRSGETRNLTEQWDRSAEQLVWSPDSRSLVGSIDDAGTRRLYRFELKGAAPKAITSNTSFSSPDLEGSMLVAIRQSFTEPPTVVSVNARNGAATKLSDLQRHRARGHSLGQSRERHLQGGAR